MGQNKTKKAQPSLPCIMCSHQQHCNIKLCYGISSREELQNSVHKHHSSFLPISISCGLPNTAPIQTCPHSQSRYCLFSGEKCWLTAQRQAYLVAWALWRSIGCHQVPSKVAPSHLISHHLCPWIDLKSVSESFLTEQVQYCDKNVLWIRGRTVLYWNTDTDFLM